MEIKNVFFDLDHTLWDFERNSALTFELLFNKYKLDIDLNSFLKVYVPINLEYWRLYRNESISKEYLRFNRLNDAFNDLFIITSNESFWNFILVSLILSNITIVSFNEYPTIVKNAAIIVKSISIFKIEKIPRVIKTSCIKAARLPYA